MRKCQKTLHPVTPLIVAMLYARNLHWNQFCQPFNSKTVELLPYIKFNTFSLQKCRSRQWNPFRAYLLRERWYLKRGSSSNVNSMGDCDGATQSERRRWFPVTTFQVISMVSMRHLQPLFSDISNYSHKQTHTTLSENLNTCTTRI